MRGQVILDSPVCGRCVPGVLPVSDTGIRYPIHFNRYSFNTNVNPIFMQNNYASTRRRTLARNYCRPQPLGVLHAALIKPYIKPYVR